MQRATPLPIQARRQGHVPQTDLGALGGAHGIAGLPIRRQPTRGTARALPRDVRQEMERGLGEDFAGVRVHEGDVAPSVGALAFAQGNAIHMARGAYRPHSADGRGLLAHELAHVVQQRRGRVRATGRTGGLPLNNETGLEREADVAAQRAMSGSKAWRHDVAAGAHGSQGTATAGGAGGPVQMTPFWKKALAGAGIVGGTAAAIGGAFVASPLLAAGLIGGGLLSAVGGAGYLGHEHYHNDRDRVLQSIHNEVNPYDNPHRVAPKVKFVDDPKVRDKGETSRLKEDKSKYEVKLNKKEKDPHKRESYRIHELTHISSDQKYSMNAPNMGVFYNEHDDKPKDRKKYLDKRYKQLQAQVHSAKNLIDGDKHLTSDKKEYIHSRLQYAVSDPMHEFDTVMNELVSYMSAKGISKSSPTSKRIAELAREASLRRNRRN